MIEGILLGVVSGINLLIFLVILKHSKRVITAEEIFLNYVESGCVRRCSRMFVRRSENRDFEYWVFRTKKGKFYVYGLRYFLRKYDDTLLAFCPFLLASLVGGVLDENGRWLLLLNLVVACLTIWFHYLSSSNQDEEIRKVHLLFPKNYDQPSFVIQTYEKTAQDWLLPEEKDFLMNFEKRNYDDFSYLKYVAYALLILCGKPLDEEKRIKLKDHPFFGYKDSVAEVIKVKK